MLVLLWLRGTIAHRSPRLLGVAAGIALTVALLGAIGAFVGSSSASMTRRAIAGVPVDWQVKLAPGVDPAGVRAILDRVAHPDAAEIVGYAGVSGLSATTGTTVQTTGAGRVVGLSPQYTQQFPGELRLLVGSSDGVLIAQQTAANLHVAPGDSVAVQRDGLPPVSVQVSGVVDLPNADSFFQSVGAPPGSGPQVPPDNVLLLPLDRWHQLFDPQAAAHPNSVQTQLHVWLPHNLPADPGAAFTAVQQRARSLEAALAGNGQVGDNLAARLSGVQADALYAQLLFLFLGLPGAILGVLLTLAVAGAGADRRRREQALLRTRGASAAQALRIAGVEATVAAVAGVAVGLALAVVVGRAIAPLDVGVTRTVIIWRLGASIAGLLLALAAVLYPAWRQTRRLAWQTGHAAAGRGAPPLWQQLYLDGILLGIAAVIFWLTARSGYQVVLAPEGVAGSSVAYQTFLAPVCFWFGVALFTLRISSGGLARGRRPLGRLLQPLAHGLADTVAAFLGRQRLLVSRGVVLVALAVAFAISTAVFNTTYNAQARVDAQLTNGADVAVTGSTTSPAGARLEQLSALPGVVSAAPLQHRFAYVGTDLQDLYGIDPLRIGSTTPMANAFFGNGNARSTLAALAARPDGVLVSAETAKDFQLQPGDQLQLRLQGGQDHQYHVVTFHFVGIVREFPTAPKDSFLVTNADYVAQQTGIAGAEVVLLRTSGNPAALAGRARVAVQGTGSTVSDIGAARQQIGSSLTAVNLQGLTQVELAFALLMGAGATGLVLALGLLERRRMFTVLVALGAKSGQLGAFLWSEGLVILLGGGVAGTLLGFAVAQMLVRLLTGVFDPPPQALSVPWQYLLAVLLVVAAPTAIVVLSARRLLSRAGIEGLRGT